jgi:glucose dehydrogenase
VKKCEISTNELLEIKNAQHLQWFAKSHQSVFRALGAQLIVLRKERHNAPDQRL